MYVGTYSTVPTCFGQINKVAGHSFTCWHLSVAVGVGQFPSARDGSSPACDGAIIFFFNSWSKDSLPFCVPFFIFTFNCKASFFVGIHYFSIMTTKLSVQLQWSWSDLWKNFEQHAEKNLGTPQGQITKTWTLLNPCNHLMLLTHSWQAKLHDSYSKAWCSERSNITCLRAFSTLAHKTWEN